MLVQNICASHFTEQKFTYFYNKNIYILAMKYLWTFYDGQNKQQYLPYTPLTYWSLSQKCNIFCEIETEIFNAVCVAFMFLKLK